MEISRARLHELVWSSPLEDVAAGLGITRAELDVLIATLDVPFPYSGYWRGGDTKSGAKRRLPRGRPGTPEAVEITAIETAPSGPEPTPFDSGQERSPETDAAPNFQGGADATEAASAASANQVGTTKRPTIGRLANPHRIIAARIAEDRRLQQALSGWSSSRPLARESEVARRRHLIESRLFTALEKAGHQVKADRGSIYQVRLIVGGHSITYAIRERYTQKRRPLSSAEMHEPYNIQTGRTSTVERFMTGQLILSAQVEGVWAKREWRDEAETLLEDQTSSIVRDLEGLANEATEYAARRQEEERRRWAEQARREEAARQARAEEDQWRRFRELAARADEAQTIRRFIDHLRRRAADDGEVGADVERWLAWAEAKLEAFDPSQRTVTSIMSSIRSAAEAD